MSGFRNVESFRRHWRHYEANQIASSRVDMQALKPRRILRHEGHWTYFFVFVFVLADLDRVVTEVEETQYGEKLTSDKDHS